VVDNESWDERFFHYLAIVNASTNKVSCLSEVNDAYAFTSCPSNANHSYHFYMIRSAKFNIALNQAGLYQSETVAMIFNRASLSAVQVVRTSTGNPRPLILEP
uniref:Uncharacterized protein n=1 Tax=Romanomermis culicivorax TaxID=13658 RepID=A0A915HN18_ROMCU